ncbi:hypothetical protein D4764_08G0010650, partial [Takifugu flavidus]
MRSCVAAYPINMRHLGGRLSSSHLFECDSLWLSPAHHIGLPRLQHSLRAILLLLLLLVTAAVAMTAAQQSPAVQRDWPGCRGHPHPLSTPRGRKQLHIAFILKGLQSRCVDSINGAGGGSGGELNRTNAAIAVKHKKASISSPLDLHDLLVSSLNQPVRTTCVCGLDHQPVQPLLDNH